MSRELKNRLRQDFSDIDHLDRATEVFMREQRKALGARHRQCAAGWKVWLLSNRTRLTVAAALVLVCGIALFAGVRFLNRGPDLRLPEESSFTETVDSKPEQQTSAEAQVTPDVPEKTEPREESEQSSATTTSPGRPESSRKAETSAGTLPSDSVTTASRTTESIRSSSTGVDSAGYDAPSNSSAPTIQTTTPAETSRTTMTASRTTTTMSALGSTTKTTTTTTRTTTSATRTTATTTKTTTTTTRTTTKVTTTTTKATTTTTTTTTAPPQPELVVKNVKLGKCERYGTDQYSQTLSVIVYNNSAVKHTDATKLRFYIQYAPNISHVGCTSGNANQTQYNAGTVTFSYNATLTAWSYDTITIRVIADEPFINVSF